MAELARFEQRFNLLLGERLDRRLFEAWRRNGLHGIGDTDFGAGPREERRERHPTVAERLSCQGMVAARHPTRLVVGAQPGEVTPQVLCCHAADIDIASFGQPGAEVVLVAFDRAGAEGFRRLVLQEAVDGLDKLEARWSSVHRKTLLFWGLPNRPSPGQQKHRSLVVYGVFE